MSDSDDLVCLSKRPGLPNLWECRKIIKNYIEVAIGRGEQPTFDGVLTHLGRIYDGDIKGDEKLLKKLQDKYDKLAEELAKNSAVLKASKPLDRNGNLTEADLCTLEEKEWLNDAIINEYLKLVVKNQKATGIRNFSS
ncbi:Oidioi.mRNA.OKI2018_I69.chr2.g6340.t1.cds [Oikopleura dioica]|uniref:Oidioi.mRNA.OKI2018_I69.chr2.g6340.t1.cds n=1 Tax=Oikopleura dioica TaxID=34765 RepID=A0ABN7T9R3_OIKDI|nr:Oidioi.mRNA.OKI2018_I69.chr2.g6340.t1.cds [Oikopleura dioica]